MRQLSLLARWDPLSHDCETAGPYARGIAGAFVPYPYTREPQCADGGFLHVIDAHPATGAYPPRWMRVLCQPHRLERGGFVAHARFDGAKTVDPRLPGAPLTGPWGLVLVVTLTACDLQLIRLRRSGMFFEANRIAMQKATVKP